MRRNVKVALGAGAAALVLAAMPVGVLLASFAGDSPIVEGRIAPGVLAVRDGFTTSFVLDAGDGVVLVDAGSDPEGEALLAAVDQPVYAVLITHGHGDHVGACAKFPGAAIVALEAEVPLIQGETSAKGPITRFGTTDGTCRVTMPVKDGQTLRFGDLDLQVLAVPGHTGGSAAYLAHRTLFLGDAASASTSGEVTPAKWIFTDDQGRANQSLASLAGRVDGVDVLAFAHTGPLAGIEPLKRFTP